jgi:hypothetical protein
VGFRWDGLRLLCPPLADVIAGPETGLCTAGGAVQCLGSLCRCHAWSEEPFLGGRCELAVACDAANAVHRQHPQLGGVIVADQGTVAGQPRRNKVDPEIVIHIRRSVRI